MAASVWDLYLVELILAENEGEGNQTAAPMNMSVVPTSFRTLLTTPHPCA